MLRNLSRRALRLLARPARYLPAPDPLKEVRRLDLRARGFVDSLYVGEYESVFLGRGMEFSHVRAYQPGEDVRMIDWRVTARAGTPFVRQFIEERDLHVVLLVDVSGSARFGPGDKSPQEVAAEVAAGLAFAATRHNDRVSLVLVSDRVEHFVPIGSGRRYVFRLLTELITHIPQGRGTDLSVGLNWLADTLLGRASIFLISDFIKSSPESSLRGALMRVGSVHDLVAVRLLTAATLELPDVGWVEMNDPESGRRVTFDSGQQKVREEYHRSALRAQTDTAALLGEVGAELLDVDTASDPLAALARFFQMRGGMPR
jgi:uncharacterized protein (DUF58 family)